MMPNIPDGVAWVEDCGDVFTLCWAGLGGPTSRSDLSGTVETSEAIETQSASLIAPGERSHDVELSDRPS